MDTLTANVAMFKLSCSIFLKKKDNNKVSIFLFLLPPSIRAIELETDGDRASLHFYMDQDAVLVVPSDGRLDPKKISEQLLSLMKALCHVKDFTIQLGIAELSESTKSNLGHVASIFSPNNLSRPNPQKVNLKSLYHGRGGEIMNVTAAAASNISSKASPPPPYPPKKRQKRKHSSISSVAPDSSEESESSVEDGLDGITSNVKSGSRETLKSSMEARFAGMEARLAATEASLADTKVRLADTEARLDKLINWVKDIRTHFMSGLQAVREQYGEEEMEKRVNFLLDAFVYSTRLDHEVNFLVDFKLDDIRTEIYGKFDDKFEKLVEEHKEEAVKGFHEIFDTKVQSYMKELLSHTKLEISFDKEK